MMIDKIMITRGLIILVIIIMPTLSITLIAIIIRGTKMKMNVIGIGKGRITIRMIITKVNRRRKTTDKKLIRQR
jgi:hypothetical protein